MAPKGLKTTSSPLQISAKVTETATGAFTVEEIPLTLNVLDNEVFVITQINIDADTPEFPFAGSGGTTSVSCSLSSTRRTSVGSIADSNVLGTAKRSIVSDILGHAVAFDREDPLFSAISEDYLGIVATNNMFLNIEGANNLGTTVAARVRVYGYRAAASASVYAALVQSELLSA